jgi:hypothetical protein
MITSDNFYGPWDGTKDEGWREQLAWGVVRCRSLEERGDWGKLVSEGINEPYCLTSIMRMINITIIGPIGCTVCFHFIRINRLKPTGHVMQQQV